MIKWYHWGLFVIVTLVALAMSWYSMTDLTHNGFGVPWILAASVSLVFDVGGIFLGLMAIEYAKTQDNGVWVELSAFLFIAASVYINVQHAVWGDYGTVGMVVFGAAPVVTGIILKVILSFLTRQARRQAGRVVDKLPTIGVLTWVRYFKPSVRLMSLAMQHRLIQAADRLDKVEDRHSIFAGQAQVSRPAIEAPETTAETLENTTPALPSVPHNSPLNEPRTPEDIEEIVYMGEVLDVPKWLPREPTMSLGKIAQTCIENGQTDVGTILSWAKIIKQSDVKYGSMYKAVQRARQSLRQ